jgi:hypothetical protein
MRAGVMWSLIPLAVLAGATTLAVPNSIAQGVPREPRTIDEMVAASMKTLGHDDFRMRRNAASSLGNFGPEAR